MTREKNRPAGNTDQNQNITVTPETIVVNQAPSEIVQPNIGMAILYGLIAAVASAFIWDKIVFFTHYKLGLVAVIIGVIVGIAVLKGAKGGHSKALPIIGAVLAGFGILLGEYLLLGDLLGSEVAKDTVNGKHLSYSGQLLVSMFIFPKYLFGGGMSPMSWVFILIGIYEGWKIPSRAADGAFSSEKK
ncbi:hypothetical protein [uncultured Desulfobulbus sp.]|uniref:hypothetical protein n=1 Tax=uncultured Desulfobulbus sp. TaxID=239745 RepID=UPI0029C84FFD|nr:hypothetical protein [uncultured Desulfobulbus sp.]